MSRKQLLTEVRAIASEFKVSCSSLLLSIVSKKLLIQSSSFFTCLFQMYIISFSWVSVTIFSLNDSQKLLFVDDICLSFFCYVLLHDKYCLYFPFAAKTLKLEHQQVIGDLEDARDKQTEVENENKHLNRQLEELRSGLFFLFLCQ